MAGTEPCSPSWSRPCEGPERCAGACARGGALLASSSASAWRSTCSGASASSGGAARSTWG
eukprot:9607030-Alexandrium_andersonii.AAC.1